MRDDFAIFILTHGRPDNVITYDTLLKSGYTGKIFIIIDNEDKKKQGYYDKYGGKVIEFNKLDVSNKIDEGDNFGDRRAIIYARNVVYDIAKEKNINYFIQYDDDYTSFEYRKPNNGVLEVFKIKKIENIYNAMLEYYENNEKIVTLAFSQGGDHIGGANGGMFKNNGRLRKAMNSFLCSPNRVINFVGRINEDVNTYTSCGQRGDIFLTFPTVSLVQKTTQKNKGGMTDLYIDSGTYIKSFYSVMYSPSCVKIGLMGDKHKRIHHKIKWDNCTPCIIREEYKYHNKTTL